MPHRRSGPRDKAAASATRRLGGRCASTLPLRSLVQKASPLPTRHAETYTAHSHRRPGGSVQQGLSDAMHHRAFDLLRLGIV